MSYKMSFHDYKATKKLIGAMNQKQLSTWVQSIYEQGFNDSCEAMAKESVGIEAIKDAIKSTKGIGPALYERICTNLDLIQSEAQNGAHKDSKSD